MQHIKQLQLALGLLLVALVSLIIIGAVVFTSYTPESQLASAPNSTTPATPSSTPQAAAAITDPLALQGEPLFENNCSACHAISDEVVVGPGLKGVSQRRPEAWLISWIKNSQKVVQSGDKYAVDLYNKFNKTAMPSYAFTDDEIKAILKYIEVKGGGGAVAVAQP